MKRFSTPCELDLTFVDNFIEGSQLMEKFVFGGAFKWDDVTIQNFDSISFIDTISFADCCLQGADQFRHLRYLKIDAKQMFDSTLEVSTTSLKIIGDELIYD